MFITTSSRADKGTIDHAKQFAKQANIPFIFRGKLSIKNLQIENGKTDCLVYGEKRLELYKFLDSQPFFFHPNMAMVRIKRLMNGESDPYLAAAGLKSGGSVLDCTLGLGADAIVASFAVGNRGRVTALEENRNLAMIVGHGLKTWEDAGAEMIQAMRTIEVVHEDHLKALKNYPANHFDAVYFDPMFEETIEESDGIRRLSKIVSVQPITQETINEAKRVAKSRVVLKDRYDSIRFAQFGFEVLKRKTSKFHYGFISVE